MAEAGAATKEDMVAAATAGVVAVVGTPGATVVVEPELLEANTGVRYISTKCIVFVRAYTSNASVTLFIDTLKGTNRHILNSSVNIL